MNMVHVTVQTGKFEEEIQFYERYVGLKIQRDMRKAGKDLVFLGDSESSTMVEIIRSPEAGDAGNESLSVGFHAEDPGFVRDELIAGGFEPTPLITPIPGVEFFYVKDPAGVNVQFIKAFYLG